MRRLGALLLFALLLTGTAVPSKGQPALRQPIKDSVFFDGQYRYHYLYMPSRLRPERPLVMVIHGYGQKAFGYVPEMLEVAEREGFAVCYPQGLRSPRTGQPGWYIGYPQQKGMRENDDEFIVFLSRALCRKYNLENSFVTGMSNGGDMCYLLGRRYPNEFRAIASVAGQTLKWIDDTVDFEGPIPFMEIHGTADRSARWEGDITGSCGWGAYISVPRAMELWVRENGCNTEATVTRLPKKGANQVIRHIWKEGVPAWKGGPPCEVQLYEIQGGYHSWGLSDMDTCPIIWEFFKMYLQPAPSSWISPVLLKNGNFVK